MLKRADVIVWFPDDFQTPSAEAIDWFDEWLYDQDERTLIIVGRDFDAAPGYWTKMQPLAGAGKETAFANRLAKAQSAAAGDRAGIPDSDDYYWYRMEGKLKHRKVRSLAGKPEWLAGVDPAKLEMELNGRVRPPRAPPSDDYQPAVVLLESEGDPLVFRQRIEGSQVIVVANGSFLLNAQLVNHEHRKLAASLIREVGDERAVVFLESNGSPQIAPADEAIEIPTGMELLAIPPFDQILLHLALVGVVFCFARWPIFGLPREEPSRENTDFGRHVAALGELLSMTQNREYAQQRLAHYQQTKLDGRAKHEVKKPSATMAAAPKPPADRAAGADSPAPSGSNAPHS
jgi:hypothetical protein